VRVTYQSVTYVHPHQGWEGIFFLLCEEKVYHEKALGVETRQDSQALFHLHQDVISAICALLLTHHALNSAVASLHANAAALRYGLFSTMTIH
jgi:hypothetical protein